MRPIRETGNAPKSRKVLTEPTFQAGFPGPLAVIGRKKETARISPGRTKALYLKNY